MREKFLKYYKWLSKSIDFSFVNLVKLIWLLLGKLVRFIPFVVNIFVSYVKKPNISLLLLLLIIFFFLGCGYSCVHNNNIVSEHSNILLAKDQSKEKFDYAKRIAKNIDSNNRLYLFCDSVKRKTVNCCEYIKRKTIDLNLINEKHWLKIHVKFYSIKYKIKCNIYKIIPCVVWCLKAMFEPSMFIERFQRKEIFDGLVALSLFLFTWLIGGGGLIGSIITTMQENHHGAWRKWEWSLRNHTLIIGWNSNAPTIIKEHIKYCKLMLLKTPFWKCYPKRPERLIIITSGDAYTISKIIDASIGSFKKRLPITYDVYSGSYDDKQERNLLAINRANSIYVLGDEGEPAHDARVLLWPKYLEKLDKKIYCAVNIESYSLFCQQQRNNKIEQKNLDINTFNFYDSWAKKLFARLDIKSNYKSNNTITCSEISKFGLYAPHVIIVGLSEMGQAILAELVRNCHYSSNDNMRVTVIDENISERYAEFKSIYPRVDEISDIFIDWKNIETLGSKDFLSDIGDLIDNKRQTTIIVAHDDSAMAMSLALPIMNETRADGKHVKLFIRQEVKGHYSDLRIINKSDESAQQFVVYGMLDGASFGSRLRDKIAEKMKEKIEDIKMQDCRQRVYALGQILSGLGIEVWSYIPTFWNEEYELLFDDITNVKQIGRDFWEKDPVGNQFAKAYHKHWCACYLLSDDGSGVLDEKSDNRLVKFEELNDADKTILFNELSSLFNSLTDLGIYLVKRKKIPALKYFAKTQGEALVWASCIPGVRYVLGGSLAYDAMLADEYDIDLRLLIPDVGKSVEEVHRDIDAVKDMLVEQAKGDSSFSVRFIDEGGKNYIWHTKQIVKVPGIPGDPDVWLAWNIQAESTYRGIAEMASRLPRELIDRYVVAKGRAREKSESDYSETKKQWVDFIDWIIDKGGKGMNEEELKKLLEENSDKMPSFLK